MPVPHGIAPSKEARNPQKRHEFSSGFVIMHIGQTKTGETHQSTRMTDMPVF